MIGKTNATNNFGNWYGVCSSTPTAVAKVVTVQDGFKLKDGATVTVIFRYINTAANPTLNVNGTGAYPITYQTGGNIDSKSWVRNEMVQLTFAYDEWVLMKPVASENTYGEVALIDTPSDALDAASGYAATPKAVQTAINSTKVWRGICTTPTSTVAKTATVNNDFTLVNGAKIRIYFQDAFQNGVSATLNVNNTGAFYIVTSDGGTPFNNIIKGDCYWSLTYIENAYGDLNVWVLDNTTLGGVNAAGFVTLTNLPSNSASASDNVAATPLLVRNAVNGSKIWWGEAITDGINITATVGEGFMLKDGVMVRLVMDAVNPQSPNLNVNGTGNHVVVLANTSATGLQYDGMWAAGEIVEFVYYGVGETDVWVLINRKRATSTRFGWVLAGGNLKSSTSILGQVPTVSMTYRALSEVVSNLTDDITILNLTATNWTSTNTYSLETEYPSATYNLQISISSTATAEQYEAYNAAGIVGDNSTNVLTARNGKPTIDIPVKVQLFVKRWSDM